MRLLVDPEVFSYGRCGLTRYYAAVCEALRERGVQISLPLLFSNNDYQPGMSGWTRSLGKLPFVPRVLNMLSRAWFKLLARRGAHDMILLTSPIFRDEFLGTAPSPGSAIPFAMIVHDTMRSSTLPDGLVDNSGDGYLRMLYLVQRAALVICISESTRRDLLAAAPFDESRVQVVLTGNLLESQAPAAVEVTLPQRFLLFVGERSGRKGFNALVKILPSIFAQHPDLHLVATGTFTRWERDYLARFGVADRVHSIPSSDGMLVTLYQKAECLVFPTLYEGFGLPVLEAMSLGCPVITSRVSALPEIAGDAACLIDPSDPRELHKAIDRVLTDTRYRDDLRRKGVARAATFSCERMMDGIYEALMRAAESGWSGASDPTSI